MKILIVINLYDLNWLDDIVGIDTLGENISFKISESSVNPHQLYFSNHTSRKNITLLAFIKIFQLSNEDYMKYIEYTLCVISLNYRFLIKFRCFFRYSQHNTDIINCFPVDSLYKNGHIYGHIWFAQNVSGYDSRVST